MPLSLTALSWLLSALAGASPTPAPSAAVPINPDGEAYFGETHIHTGYSFDAFLGGARLDPDGAYRFARGETVEVSGQRVRLRRPLDWAAVTDHAEYMGEMETVLQPDSPGHGAAEVQELLGLQTMAEREKWYLDFQRRNRSGTPGHLPFWQGPVSTATAWQRSVEAAARHDQPGVFSTLAAYEWTAAPGGANLHRNVIFRDLTVPSTVMSALDIPREEGLWRWLAALEAQGVQALAIPHNSNASKGLMFATVDSQGAPLTAAYARLRARFEPLIEMMQVKGNSEVHRAFWGGDEFADFENGDSIGRFGGRSLQRQNFVRAGLISGLAERQRLGVNPFQYGFVGGTDNHNGTPGNTAEDNFMAGSHGAADATVELRRTATIEGWITARDTNPGALTGVWATSNTRRAIWEALQRRESFATSGTRLQVRVFAGDGFPADLPSRGDMVAVARRLGGVPMGAELPALGPGRSPQLLVWARKDPDGADLERIQVIKGWVDASGQPHERIVDVVQGNGAPVLAGLWRDPSFDPRQNALYYVRVLERPTPRWSTIDARRAGLPLLKDVPAMVRERARSSPIWMVPRPEGRYRLAGPSACTTCAPLRRMVWR